MDLLDATRKNNLEEVKKNIQNGGDINYADEDDDITALIIAATNGYLDILNYLLENKADPNLQTFTDQDSALTLAAENNHIDVVKSLIRNGADINKMNRYGFTALSYASDNSSKDMIQFLLDNGAVHHIPHKYIIEKSIKSPSEYKELYNKSKNEIGRGGFGAIRKINDSALKKVLFRAGDDELFNREVFGLQRTQKNDAAKDYVVQIKNYAKNNEAGYILMEMLSPGKPLNNFIKENINNDNVQIITTNLINGLTTIHATGLLHLDIKPQNILVYPDNKIKYIDFGLSCLNPCINHLDDMEGTMRYMKYSELIKNTEMDIVKQDKTSDFYALSKTLEDISKSTSLNESSINWLKSISKTLESLDDSGVASSALPPPTTGGRRKTYRRNKRRRRNTRRLR